MQGGNLCTVPRFEPFRAFRYAPSLALADVTAPPYDVLSHDEVLSWRSRHPANITNVDVPLDSDGVDPYAVAAQLLRSWQLDGTLVRDERESFTLYRMSFVDALGRQRHTVGVLGALEVVDEGAGGVLPHERTTPKAKTDRLDLTRATSTNLSPVWGLSLRTGLTALLEAPGAPLGDYTDELGVRHTVERVDDPTRVAAIAAAVGGAPVLIADGHHRYAVSRTYRDECRAAGGSPDAETTLTYVAELVDDQLSIDAIHRVYSGIDFDELYGALSVRFFTESAGPVTVATLAEMRSRAALCLVDSTGAGTWLTPKPGSFDGIRALDGAWLEETLRATAVDVAYQHGLDEVVAAAAEHSGAVLIRPVSIDEIRRTADEGLLMPPKSTFFTPKLRTGLVLRPLD
jgi:uncharacterized protein (DUF1015 family)